MGNLACCADDEAYNTAPNKLELKPIKKYEVENSKPIYSVASDN